MSYGYFQLDATSISYLLENLSQVEDPVIRGAGWMALYEECLRHELPAEVLFASLVKAIPSEQESLNRQNLLAYIQTLYWRFFTTEERQAASLELEQLLWNQVIAAKDISAKSTYFRRYQSIALSPSATEQLYRIWSGAEPIEGLPLSETNLTSLACELALRLPDQAEEILNKQLEQIKNPDRQKRLSFIRPSLSADPAVRDAFFESLKLAENRHYEPWVGSALGYLHHPLRAQSAEQYILPSLELMEEIQATGDIFFPRRWISATLGGHQSPAAAQIVRDFLAARPDYPYRLKNKILMGADLLFRVEGVKE